MFRYQFTIKPSIEKLRPLIHDSNVELFGIIKDDLCHEQIKFILMRSFMKGSLLIVKELVKSNFFTGAHSDKAFRYTFSLACSYGHLEIAQYVA